jgi:GNAT superfamily N-acetyltransferase
MGIVQASSEHLEEVSTLFDQYRVFYKSSSDLEAARNYLQERFQKNDSVIFVFSKDQRIVGFTQLYPSFSSVSMKRIWILNDLFVEEAHRKQGIAKSLIDAAENFARETGAVRIVLATQVFNIAAQSLYESLGYIQNRDFHYYSLQL